MRAAIITRQGAPVADNVKVADDWPEPQAGPGELIVGTEASALNHLDLFVGQGVPGLELTYPRISGCDGCGVVESVGDGVDEAWIGKRVIVNAAMPQPEPIRPGVRPALPALRMIGEHEPGTMAERFVVPQRALVEVPDAVSDDQAVFAEPLAAALHVLDAIDGGKRDSRPITVLGDGKLGQLIARALLGASHRVRLIGHHEDKLALARTAGAGAVRV